MRVKNTNTISVEKARLYNNISAIKCIQEDYRRLTSEKLRNRDYSWLKIRRKSQW